MQGPGPNIRAPAAGDAAVLATPRFRAHAGVRAFDPRPLPCPSESMVGTRPRPRRAGTCRQRSAWLSPRACASIAACLAWAWMWTAAGSAVDAQVEVGGVRPASPHGAPARILLRCVVAHGRRFRCPKVERTSEASDCSPLRQTVDRSARTQTATARVSDVPGRGTVGRRGPVSHRRLAPLGRRSVVPVDVARLHASRTAGRPSACHHEAGPGEPLRGP